MKASIILNGNSNGTMYITGELIVAVDGGAEELRRRKIIPHVLIGDMDSVTDDTLEYFELNGVKIYTYPAEKDETDLELALNYVFKHGATEVEILNWQGERIDMLLAMIGLMSKYDNVVAISDKCEVGVIKAGKKGTQTLKAIAGELWSFVPLCHAEFSIEGFKYPFSGSMDITTPIGVSNVALSDMVKVEVKNGKVVFVRWKKKPL
ncbi:thiamine diphosphokinase [Fervidobacterium islandicum]|uniref:Thiamine diphosphokinase n=1 Tax=Fervidobacterium islandicum TaxID=2423 RepID=A0AAI8CLV3_FERIS|nr:thiamine diphosphokinase [Fervidobacterium islandicum]AMW32943.1 thiamine diphosphokinase [Fervidobacterium islandicum]